jgi:hypothetical protein
MAEMTIQLKIDPATGKKDIIIGLKGDDDALPHEHEQRHKALVERLVGGGLLKASEVGQIIVEREAEEREAAPPIANRPQDERRAQSQGS